MPLHWYCPSCSALHEAALREPCPACGAELLRDRRIFEPDLPAMSGPPSDAWVAVFQPRDGGEARAAQDFLEGIGIPAMQLPGIADWVHALPEEDRHSIVHIAVPRNRAADARAALVKLVAAGA